MSAKDQRKGSVEDALGKELEGLFGETSGGPKQGPQGQGSAEGDVGKKGPKQPAKPPKKKEPEPPQAPEKPAADHFENTSGGSDLDPGLTMMLSNVKLGKNPKPTSFNLINQNVLGLLSLAIKNHSSDGIRVNNTQIVERLVEMARQDILAKGTKSKFFKCLTTEIEKAG